MYTLNLTKSLLCMVLTCATTFTAVAQTAKSIDKDKITSGFLKAIVSSQVEPDSSNADIPLYSTQEAREGRRDWVNVGYWPEHVMVNTLNRQHLQPTLGNDCIGISFSVTCGDFILVYIDSESLGHQMSTGWLVTYDYNGNRIDSLEFVRQFEGSYDYVCDLSSRLNQDLTIQQTFIDWGTDNPDFSKLVGKRNIGTRFDFEYTINSKGYFQQTKCLYYKEKVYTDSDIEVCTDNKKPKGIHLGKETLIGDYKCSTEQSEADFKKNRFPIYGGVRRHPGSGNAQGTSRSSQDQGTNNSAGDEKSQSNGGSGSRSSNNRGRR